MVQSEYVDGSSTFVLIHCERALTPAPMCAQLTVTCPPHGSTPQWATASACAEDISESAAGTGTGAGSLSALAAAGTSASAAGAQTTRRGRERAMTNERRPVTPHPGRRRHRRALEGNGRMYEFPE